MGQRIDAGGDVRRTVIGDHGGGDEQIAVGNLRLDDGKPIYPMAPANTDEALREVELDLAEGAECAETMNPVVLRELCSSARSLRTASDPATRLKRKHAVPMLMA